MDFCFYCGGKPYKQDDEGRWVCKKCESLRRTETDLVVEYERGKKLKIREPWTKKLGGKAPIRIASLEPEKKPSTDLEQKLAHFTGTFNYYPHWTKSIRWTDGIQFLVTEAGAFWLMDIVASYQPKLKAPFQLWKIKVNPDDSALVTMQEDTGQPYLVRQEIPYTDFPLKDFEFYCIDGVCMVKSEY